MRDARIEPALTLEEWAARGRHAKWRGCDVGVYFGWPRSGVNVVSEDSAAGLPSTWTPKLIALANAALPDSDPRKITREKVRVLRNSARRHEATDGMGDDVPDDDSVALNAMADALESYLPPDNA